MSRIKSSVILSVAASFLAFSAPANASDLLDSMAGSDKMENASINWSGAYIGGALGYGNADHNLSAHDYFKDYCGRASSVGDPFVNRHRDDRAGQLDQGILPTCDGTHSELIAADSREIANLDGLNSAGIVGDFRLGYDKQMGRFIFGLYGTYGLSSMEANGSIDEVGSFKLERGDDWSAGARAGVLVNDRTLLYALVAYTQTEYDLSVTDGTDTLSKNTDFDGITVGGGIEFAVSKNIFLGLEGTHTFYNEETVFDIYDAAHNVGVKINDDLGETKIMGTLKAKLGF